VSTCIAWNNVRDQHLLPSCMRFLEASHVVEIMRKAGSAGMHVRDLAARADCDSSKLGLSRIVSFGYNHG
jgi:hypothetical protein